MKRRAGFGLFGCVVLCATSSITGRAPLPMVSGALSAPLAAGPFGPAPFRQLLDLGGAHHVSAIRARFAATTHGVPTRYRWEALDCASRSYRPIADAAQDDPGGPQVLARRRTWFVDVDACGLVLEVLETNGGPPAIEHLEAIDGAKNVLLGAQASGTGTQPDAAVDGSYERAFVGEPGKGTWTLEARLPHAERVDRVRMVLGADATTLPRPGLGRSYAVARGPLRWTLAASEDGERFTIVARSTDPRVRRPLLHLPPRPVVALRFTFEGATDDSGAPSPNASPVIREVAAYSADDAAPLLAEPWVLSINANPAASAHAGNGGELANDVYFAKFLQKRFQSLLPAMARDDRYARRLGGHGELLAAKTGPSDGRVLEAIEGDDPAFERGWLTASWPPPVAVLSGSNDWDYARKTSVSSKGRTRWNPLLPAREGGMGDLEAAVKARATPFLGFCGGAQILALLEAKKDGNGDEIDAVLRRNTGRLIRGFATNASLIRSWPGEKQPPPRVTFEPTDPLFVDLAGPSHRNATLTFPQSHLDLVRPEAFASGGPLERFQILATSLFCSPAVVASLHPLAFAPNPSGAGRCARVTEVFRARHGRFPLIGAQFHAEQRDFDSVPAGEPPESAADARMFVAAAWEEIVDAYITNAASLPLK